jgi:PAS domain S-box-containing protein
MGEQTRILHIEDNPADARLIKEMLSEYPGEFLIDNVGRLSEGIERLSSQTYDIALVDLGLPDSAGIESFSAIQPVAPGMPIVILSGMADEELAVEIMRRDAQSYLVKGQINPHFLKNTIVHSIERCRLLRKLRESESLLNEVGSIARVGGWELDADRKEVRWTRETYRIHEVPEGKNIQPADAMLFFDEPGRSALAEAVERGIEKGEPLDLELPFTSATGRHRWTRAIARPVTAGGRVLRLTGTFQDITEQKKLELERDTTIRVLRSINNTNGVPRLIEALVSVLHESFDVEAIGIRLREGEDYPYFDTRGFSDEFVGFERMVCAYDEHGQLLRNDEGNPILECICGMVIEGDYPSSARFFTKDGSFWTNSTTQLLKGADAKDLRKPTRNRCNREGYESVALVPLRYAGETFGLIHFADKRRQCFTPELIALMERLSDSVAMALSQRQGEVRIRESEEKWRTLFESSKDVIYLSTFKGRFIDINKAGEELFGRTRQELLTLDLDDIYKDPGNREVLIERIVRDGFVRDFEVVLKKKDGTTVDCLITATARKDEDGNTNGIQGIIRDITEQKRVGERILQMEKLSSLGGILSGVAHELNNPLTAIIGNAQLLTRKNIPGEYRDKLEIIQRESVRCTKIVSGLLAFAREHKPERRLININDIIMESHKLREYELRVDNVAMELVLSEDLPETAADPYQLQQVFINLINNAHDAVVKKGGGALTISSRHKNGKIHVEFADNGIGIPDENRKRIFDPFFTTKEVSKGTGLGLSIIYGIIAEHDGMIDVDSKLGEYTRFIIELPVVADIQPVVTREKRKVEKPVGSKSVLVVDDEDSLREMIAETLAGEGYLVESTGNGQEALDIIQLRDFNAIVSDMKMPMMGGKELYAYIVNNNPDLARRIIFITGDVLGQDTQQFLNITGNRYIEKPFQINELLMVLSEVLAGK